MDDGRRTMEDGIVFHVPAFLGSSGFWAGWALLLLVLVGVCPASAQTDTTNVWFTNGPNGPPSPILVQSLAIDPLFPDTLYAATLPGTISRSLNRSGSWTEVGSAIADTVLALAINPKNSAVIYAGTAHRGVFRSSDRAATWDSVNTGLTNRQINVLAVDPVDTSTVYAGTSTRLFKTTNGGASWSLAGLDSVAVSALALNPQRPDTVYAGTNGAGMFRSFDGGASWTQANGGLSSLRIAGLVVDAARPDTVYAATYDAGVFRSFDGGDTWRAVNNGLSVVSLTCIAMAPGSFPILYVGTSNGSKIFKSADNGETWVEITRNLPAQAVVGDVVVRPDSANVLYAGLSQVYRLRQAGLDLKLAQPTPGHPVAVSAADLDGSGSVDPLVANGNEGTVSLFRNHENGTFFFPQTLVVGGDAVSVSSGDLNGDGKVDLVVGNRASQVVAVLLNNGAGVFSTRFDLFVGQNVVATALADVDGDGHLDILTLNGAPGNSVSLFVNNGLGNFLPPRRFPCGSDPSGFAVADFDGDGLADVLTANRGDGSVSLLRNLGGASFGPPQSTDVGGSPTAIFAGDLDLDGHPDAAVALSGSSELVVLHNTGAGGFVVSERLSLGFVPLALTGSDMDRDGYIDLLVSGTNAPVDLLVNNGRGDFDLPAQVFDGTVSIRSLDTADLNGDGDPDMLGVRPDKQSLFIHRNDLPQDIKAPSPPRLLKAQDVQGDLGGRIGLSWNLPRVDEETGRVLGYRVFRAAARTGPYAQVGQVNAAQTPVAADSVTVQGAFVDSMAQVDTTYFYYVTAFGPNQAVSTPSDTASAVSRAQPFFVFDFSGNGAYHAGDSIEVSVSLIPLQFAISGVSLFLNYDPKVLSVVDALPATPGVQPVRPADSVLKNSQILENRLNKSLAGGINYSLAALTAPDTSRIDLGTIRFVALKDSLTYLTVVDSPSVNRHTAVVEAGTGAVVMPYLTPNRYALQIKGVRLFGSVKLQGRTSDSTRLRIDLRKPGGALPDSVYRPVNDLDQNPANGVQLDSDSNGNFSLVQVRAGTYAIYVKAFHYLRAVVVGDSVKVSATAQPRLQFKWKSSTGTVYVDTLRGGDGNDDDQVNLADFGILASAFGATDVQSGQPAWRADFNGDGAVNLADFGILASNFGEVGMGHVVFFKPAPTSEMFALSPRGKGVFALVLADSGRVAGFSAEVLSGAGDGATVLPGTDVAGQAYWIDRKVGPGRARIAAHLRTPGGVFGEGAELARIQTGGPPPQIVDLSVIDPEGRLKAVLLRGGPDAGPADLPTHPALYQNAPNPFNPETSIRFDVSRPAEVVLTIYSLLGQEVRTLVRGTRQPGAYTIVWDGRDGTGRPVASGVYLYRISIGTFREVRKLLLLK